MPTTILQAAVGAGKTETALKRLSQTINDRSRPFARAWVLLATKRQEYAFRQRLIDLDDGRSVYFNAEFFNFYELNAHLLNLNGQPPRRIDEAARIRLLRTILFNLLDGDELQTFAPIARKVGFLSLVADLIYELKQNRVYPDAFKQASTSAKDRELALIYAQYQAYLQRFELVDREGEGWLALEALETNPTLGPDVDLLLVDGYDQFTPVQSALIAQLSTRIADTTITLTTSSADNRNDVHKPKRFDRARERLLASHTAIGAEISVSDETDPNIPRHPDLLALGQRIFSAPDPVPAQGGIHLIEAPEPQQEVAAVLRDLKTRLLAGENPDDMLIALRDWSRYHTYFDLYARLYQLPLLLHYGDPIGNNPAVKVLMDTLALVRTHPDHVTSFRRRAVLDILRSPYVQVAGMDDEQIDLLERVSREKQVIGGRKHWLSAIYQATQETQNEDGDIYDPLLTITQEAHLSTVIEDFFTHVTPPTHARLVDYVQWLEDLIGRDPLQHPDDALDEDLPQPDDPYTLNMPRCVRQIADQPDTERIINRDTQALNQFKELLRGMVTTQDFLQSALGMDAAQLTWEDIFSQIQAGVKSNASIQRNPIRSGRVLVTTATEARGLPHQHVYILGLSEGLFPLETAEDPIYLDTERRHLQERGVLLETATERTDDDGLFYELISLPRQSLVLSRPYIREGKPWNESHLWRMTEAVFTTLPRQRIGIGEIVPATAVASVSEAMLAVAQGLTTGHIAADDDLLDLYQWLRQHHGADWRHIEHGHAAESQRLSRQAHDVYSGQLQHPDLIDYVQTRLHRRTWSASQLNEYGVCPYRFFAKRLLRLEEQDDPQEGLDALQLGLVNHKILEETYREFLRDDLAIVPEHQDEALAILEEQADLILRTAPMTYQFRASALWQEEQVLIKRRLRAMVALDFSADAPLNKFGTPRKPFALELGFGFAGTPRVRVPANADEMLDVRGSIDRVDQIGDRLLVIDYKTGSTPIKTDEMREGRNFQMMVYLLALADLARQNGWTQRIAGGAFWHIRNQETSGELELSEHVDADPDIQHAQAHITRYLAQARSGHFAVQPNTIEDGKCTRYCEFYQLCRLANTHPYKEA